MAIVIHPPIPKIMIVCACVGIVLGVGIWTSERILNRYTGAAQELKPSIVNKTSALEIVSTAKVVMGDRDVLKVTLKNISEKNIISYKYLVGQAGITNGYAFSERLFAPGETREEYIPYDNLQTAATASPETETDLVFAAVWFEGGTGDGDPKFINRLRDEFAGIREQAGRILPLIRKARQDPEIQEAQVLSDLELQISQLSTEDDATSQSLDYKLGRSMANRQLASKVKELKENKNRTSGNNRKAEVTGNLASWETLLTRF